ncbi:MAG: MBL fold metallo-hydrolase [Desulfurococcaceae archaeon]
MEISYLRVTGGPLATNTYIVYRGDLGFIIDPGAEIEIIENAIKNLGLRIIAFIIATHGHFDHVYHSGDLSGEYNAPVIIHEADVGIMNRSGILGLVQYRKKFNKPTNIKPISQEGKIDVNGFQLNVIHTPGHTPGSVCLQIGSLLFTGDTLFKGTVGRTDLRGGSEKNLMRSLAKLTTLEGDFRVLPGHGEETTLREELLSNPFLNKLSKNKRAD